MKPTVIQIFGDKSKKLEAEHHRIEFPGGSIAVDRTSDGEYWAHIKINTEEYHAQHDGDFTEAHELSKIGQCVDSRIDFDHSEYTRRSEAGLSVIPSLPNIQSIEHVAVRFATKGHA